MQPATRPMRVLVTGGFGYLGSHLTDSLAAAGHTVRVLERRLPASPSAWQQRFETFVGDVSDPASLPPAFEGVEAVVHAAALNAPSCAADPEAAVRVNGLGTRNVLAAAAAAGARRAVYLSSIHVYGPLAQDVIDEATPTRPVSDYAITKLLGESYCGQAVTRGEIEALVVRFSNGYGAPLSMDADCWMLAVPDFCRQAYERGEIVLQSAGTQQRDFLTLAEEVAAVRLLIEEAPSPKRVADVVYTAGGGCSRSMREVAELVADVYRERFGREAVIRLPEGAYAAPAEPPVDYRFERLAALGYRPEGDMRAQVDALFTLLAGG